MERKRLNIGVDIDGVLADFMGGARKLLKEMFDGRPNDSLVQTGWGLDSLGFSLVEERQFWEQLDRTPNWWMGLKTLPNTNILADLCQTHRVIFITNRKDAQVGKPIEQQSAIWLMHNYPIYIPTVVISDDKGPVARGLKLDAYIDDRPKNVREVAEQGITTYLKRATYNTEFEHPLCVDNFNEFALKFLPKVGRGYVEILYQSGRCIA